MNIKIEEEYADTLFGIEVAIVSVVSDAPELVDRNVLAAIDALIALYSAETRRDRRSLLRPTGLAGAVYERCLRTCEWQLGREDINGVPVSGNHRDEGKLSVSEVLRCLKRLRKSIRFWHKQGGRRGYLSYVSEFVGDADGRSSA